MIKIEDVEINGWEAAIRGMRNPKNSWGKSDSIGYCCANAKECEKCPHGDYEDNQFVCNKYDDAYIVGDNDLTLMRKLCKAGTDHRKYLRMINVTMDIAAPLYWWKEWDTYKVGTVRNSCSTMHMIVAREFVLDDFSHEHLNGHSEMILEDTIKSLNAEREYYLKSKDKSAWWQLIQLLPSSYNQLATVQVNYEVLMNMYHSRKAHKLDEWVRFCEWILTLPYMNRLIDDKKEGKSNGKKLV